MKVLSRIVILFVLSTIVVVAQAQFISASKGAAKKKSENPAAVSDRQKDIQLLEQREATIERDLSGGNFEVFGEHKLAVLLIMDREVSRSGYDLEGLKSRLYTIDSDSKEGRALRIEILQMEGRLNRQKYIRSQVEGFTVSDVNVENTKALSGMKSMYFQFIDNMKVNLKNFEGVGEQAVRQPQKAGTSNSTSAGANENSFTYSSKDKK
jgi:hypothetical protein